MKKQKKILFRELAPAFIHGGSQGWEIPLDKGNIPSGYFYGMRMTAADKKDIRDYLKGLKILFNRASQNHAFDDVVGNYKGVEEKYKAILKSLRHEDITKIGAGSDFSLTFYIDGSVGSHVK